MDKNTIVGFVLIALVLFGFAWWQQPSAEELEKQRIELRKDSIANAKKAQADKNNAKMKAGLLAEHKTDSTALFYSALNGNAKDIILKNDKVELTLNTKGGIVKKAVIKNYIGHNIAVRDGSKDDKNVTLFSGDDQNLNFMLSAKEDNIETKNLYFTPSNISDSTLTLTASAGDGKSITLNYKLEKDYMLQLNLQTSGMAGMFKPEKTNYSLNGMTNVNNRKEVSHLRTAMQH